MSIQDLVNKARESNERRIEAREAVERELEEITRTQSGLASQLERIAATQNYLLRTSGEDFQMIISLIEFLGGVDVPEVPHLSLVDD